MAITRTAKGTASAYDEDTGINSISLASVAIAEGASVVVTVAAHPDLGTITSATWNGQALAVDQNQLNATNVRAAILSRHANTGATGTVVVNFTNLATFAGAVIAVMQIEGLSPTATDQAGGQTGTGTTPAVGPLSATTRPDEILVCAIGMDVAAGIGGSWTDSFSDGQSVSDGNGVSLNDGYRVVAATGAYSTSKTGTTSGDWVALMVTYKSVDQYSAPASVEVVLTPNTGTTDVVAVPASVGMIAASSGGATNVLAKPASVEVALSVPTQVADNVPDTYDPTVATSQSFVPIRATTPANLGDADVTTVEGAPTVSGVNAVVEVKATVMADVPAGQQFATISHVVFRAIAYIQDEGPNVGFSNHTTWPGWPTHPNTRFAWKVSAVEAESAAISDDPAVGTGDPGVGFVLPIKDDPFDAADNPHLDHYIHTANITTQPNGSAWTWAAINALADVCVRWSWAGADPAFSLDDLVVCEMFAEVYGPQGSDIPPIEVTTMMGKVVKTLKITSSI